MDACLEHSVTQCLHSPVHVSVNLNGPALWREACSGLYETITDCLVAFRLFLSQNACLQTNYFWFVQKKEMGKVPFLLH